VAENSNKILMQIFKNALSSTYSKECSKRVEIYSLPLTVGLSSGNKAWNLFPNKFVTAIIPIESYGCHISG
jgi:hypothetical protein